MSFNTTGVRMEHIEFTPDLFYLGLCRYLVSCVVFCRSLFVFFVLFLLVIVLSVPLVDFRLLVIVLSVPLGDFWLLVIVLSVPLGDFRLLVIVLSVPLGDFRLLVIVLSVPLGDFTLFFVSSVSTCVHNLHYFNGSQMVLINSLYKVFDSI